jgi:hypothetical protein
MGRYLMSPIDASLNLTLEFPFLHRLNEFHILRVVQSDGPGMLQACHRGDDSTLIALVSTGERPTPIHAIFRTETRSTIAKNAQRETS